MFVEAIAKKDSRLTRVSFDVSGVVGIGKCEDNAALITRRIRELGVDRVLYGSDGAGEGNLAPREAWAAFRKLSLSDAEFLTIAHNIAPYMR